MSYNISELKSENKYTQSLPAYLRGVDGYSYVKFYSFIKMLTNYVKHFQTELEHIYDCINNYGLFGVDKNGEPIYCRSVLDILCDNYGVDYTDEIPLVDLNTALRCAGLRRSSFSTIADMNNGFLSVSRIFTAYTIQDNALSLDSNVDDVMSVSLSTFGVNPAIGWEFLFSQILPRVTGVDIVSKFAAGSVFAYDSDGEELNTVKLYGWDIGSWRWEQLK